MGLITKAKKTSSPKRDTNSSKLGAKNDHIKPFSSYTILSKKEVEATRSSAYSYLL